MNLVRALAATPLRWALSTKEITSKRTGRQVPVLSLMVWLTPESGPIEEQFHTHTAPSVDGMLAAFLAEHDKANPALLRWRLERGEETVALEDGVLDCLGEVMHRGLRKLADSPQSAIIWNALHHIHADDRVAVWSAARSVVQNAFAVGSPVIRRDLAIEPFLVSYQPLE